jgi:pimeloyl-ACP methyl ester carboxylesterase
LKVFCLHETGTGPAVWAGLAEAAIGDRADVIAHERLGWRDDTPEDYRATTIGEQAEDAAKALAELGEPAVLCGVGLGAVVALDLLLARSQLVLGAVLIEPPLLAFSGAATEQLSADRVELSAAVQTGGVEAGVELCLSGSLPALSPGTDRLATEVTAPARERPLSFIAELSAVPAWSLPLPAFRASEIPAAIVVSEGTPPLVRDTSEELAARLASAELHGLSGAGPAHVDAAAALAELVVSGGVE